MILDQQDSVYILKLINGARENAINQTVLDEYNQVFDEIEASSHPACLVIQSEHHKTFCNGLDLMWLLQQNTEDKKDFITRLENTYIRLALLNLPVIANINGNAYAGGAILTAACDFRFMRADRGRLCFPEVNINIPYTPAITEIVKLLPNPYAVWQMSLTGQALTGEECLAAHIADQIHPMKSLDTEVLKFAENMARKNRATYTTIKHYLRSTVADLAKRRGIYNDRNIFSL